MIEKNTILIADDAELNRELIKYIFEEQYQILEAEDGEQTIDLMAKYNDKICLLFLDLLMQKKSGLDVLKFMIEKKYIESIPVIMITGEATDETDEKAYEYGASEIIYKPFAPNVVMRRAKNLIELFEHRVYLEYNLEKHTKQLQESKKKLEKNNEFLLNLISSVVEFRSQESEIHIQKIKYFTKLFLKYIRKYYPQYGLTEEQSELIAQAAAIHDIGKIAIPDKILLKTEELTKAEREEIEKHTIYGCQILERIKQEDSEFYQYCYDICRFHHERYDGTGYPDHLKGDAIPIWAQVVSIVNAYDALVSKRIYKFPCTVEQAERKIMAGECGAFSPVMLDCFRLAKSELIAVTEREGKLFMADTESNG